MVPSRQVKGGYLLRYKRRFLGFNTWREQWVVLHEDSTLAWFKDKGRRSPEGSLRVRDAPDLLAVSQWTLRIPGRPRLPQGCGVLQLLAVGQGKMRSNHVRKVRKVQWLLARDQQECHEWMTAISLTLPPLPPPPPPLPPRSASSKSNAVRYRPAAGDGVVDMPPHLMQMGPGVQAEALVWGGWGLGGGFPVTVSSCGHSHAHAHALHAHAAQPAASHDHHAALAAHHDCSSAATAAASTAMDTMHVDMDIGDIGDLGSGLDCLADFSF